MVSWSSVLRYRTSNYPQHLTVVPSLCSAFVSRACAVDAIQKIVTHTNHTLAVTGKRSHRITTKAKWTEVKVWTPLNFPSDASRYLCRSQHKPRTSLLRVPYSVRACHTTHRLCYLTERSRAFTVRLSWENSYLPFCTFREKKLHNFLYFKADHQLRERSLDEKIPVWVGECTQYIAGVSAASATDSVN